MSMWHRVVRSAVAGLACAAAANAGDVTSYPQPLLKTPFPLSVVETTDANGDGLLDLLAGSASREPKLSLAQAPFVYAPFERVHPSIASSECFATGDFDGDGQADVAVGGDDTVHVALGAGDGTFPAAPFVVIHQLRITALESLDADADGDLDLLAAVFGPYGVRTLLGDGAGNLLALPVVPMTSFARGLTTGDVDLDGLPDFACSIASSLAIQLALGVGGGAFGAPVAYATPNAGELELVHLDDDGWLDLAWSGSQPGMRLSLGGGALGASQPLPDGPAPSAYQLEAVDVDEDADIDLLLPEEVFVRVLVNDGEGLFTGNPQDDCAVGGSVIARDIDDDGAVDLVASTSDEDYYGTGGAYSPAGWIALIRGLQGSAFEAPLHSPMLVEPADELLVADVDGDGVDDLVLAHALSTDIALGLGDGSFAPPIASITHVGYGTCVAEAAGDFDGDGQLDLLGVYDDKNFFNPFGVRVMQGSGDGALLIGPKTSVPWKLGGLEAADLDADGDLDSLALKANGLGVLLNEGAGSFALSSAPLDAAVEDVGIGDVDGDGLPDAAAVLTDGDAVAVLLGGGGAFGAPELEYVLGARDVALGDVDGDGRDDLAVGGYSQPPYRHALTVLRSQMPAGFGLMGVADPFAVNTWAAVLAVRDATGDQPEDVLLAQGSAYAVVASDGSGSLAPPRAFRAAAADLGVSYPASTATDAMAAGLFDGDALPDFIAVLVPSSGLHAPGVRTSLAQPAATWLGLGHALPGAAGTPQLSGSGSLQPHSDLTLTVTHAAPGASAWLIVGDAVIELPFKGGTLVPAPDIVLGGLATDAHGELELVGSWPDGVPAGASLILQAWIADATGPAGFSATNGLLLSPH